METLQALDRSDVEGNITSPEKRTELRKIIKSLLKSKAAVGGLFVLFLVVCSALLAPHLAPHDPNAQDINNRLKPPVWDSKGSWTHLLGTDHLGRDILSRLIYGSRISLIVGLSAVLVSGTIGILVGLIAGYYGKWLDDVFMRLADIQLAFPFILLAIAVIAALGPGLRNIIVVLSITGWVVYARVIRAEVLSVRESEFIQAIHALGGENFRILFRHVLPNVISPGIVIATLEVARMIILESALSFLGLSVPPSTPTWGGMLNDGRQYLYNAWWLATFPGLAIMLTVLGINLLGDWVRDTLDPRLEV
jgi:peptide/nickel transport system permease protein